MRRFGFLFTIVSLLIPTHLNARMGSGPEIIGVHAGDPDPLDPNLICVNLSWIFRIKQTRATWESRGKVSEFVLDHCNRGGCTYRDGQQNIEPAIRKIRVGSGAGFITVDAVEADGTVDRRTWIEGSDFTCRSDAIFVRGLYGGLRRDVESMVRYYNGAGSLPEKIDETAAVWIRPDYELTITKMTPEYGSAPGLDRDAVSYLGRFRFTDLKGRVIEYEITDYFYSGEDIRITLVPAKNNPDD